MTHPPEDPQRQPYPSYPAYQGCPPPWAPPPAPKPGVIPLRPLGVGEVLDGAISYVRANPKVTLGLAAILATLSQLIQVPVTTLTFGAVGTPGPGTDPFAELTRMLTGPALIAFAITILVTFVTGTVLTGMLIVVVGRAVVGGSPSLGEVWAVARPRLPGLIGVSLVTALAGLGVLVVGFAPMVLTIVLSGPGWLAVIFGVVGFVLVSLALVYLWVAWSLAAPAYVLEELGVLESLRRSAQLVRAHWWRIFGILLLGALITWVLGAILAVPFSLGGTVVSALGGESGGMSFLTVLGMSITAIGAILGTTLTAPFASGISGLLYFDQRIRREGWDIELARTAGEGAPPPGPVIPRQAGPSEPTTHADPNPNPSSPGW